MSLEEVSSMEYPGRFIVLGVNAVGDKVVVYGITGRSESSRARRMVLNDSRDRIKVEPINPESVMQGNPDLLLYDAMILGSNEIVVSNGKQTNRIERAICGINPHPMEKLLDAHQTFHHEPDEPNFTPRISGVVRNHEMALGIIKHAGDGISMRNYFELPLVHGEGRFISTYSGENKNPLPSFVGEPLVVPLAYSNAGETSRFFYELFDKKFRVAVVAVHMSQYGNKDIQIANTF